MNASPSGLLNINKPASITSHDVVVKIRRLTGQRRVGHAGTLDPMATGVLLVCLGQATRLIEYVMASRKHYRATIRFGQTTDTLDAEGQIVAQSDPAHLTEAQLREISARFLGEIEQVPPLFSAIKKGGQPLYKAARAGQTVHVEPRLVTIYALTWVAWQPPDLTLEVICSPGTYIRSLARDWGEAAGTGAHLAGLTRIASGPWHLADAVPLALFEQTVMQEGAGWKKYLYPLDQAVQHLPRVTLSEAMVTHVKQGKQILLSSVKIDSVIPTEEKTDLLRAYTPAGDFLAILTLAEPNAKLWQPKKVFQIE